MTIELTNEITNTKQVQVNQSTTEHSISKSDEAENVVSTSPNQSTSLATSGNVYFPVDDLQRLDEMLNKARWVVPVLPKSELEVLLDASIALCRQNLDTKSEHCQRFFRDGLQLSFVRVLTDEAVNTWKYDIYKHIYNNTLKAIELCTLKLLDDWFPLLDLLAMIFNPQCKYHILNSMRNGELNIKIVLNKNSNAELIDNLKDAIDYDVSKLEDKDKLTTNSNNSSQIQNENENYKTLNINNEHLNDKNLDKDDERLLNELDDEEEDDDEGDDENEDDDEEDESDSDEEDEGDRLNDEDLDLDQDVNEFNRDLHNKNENLSVYSGNDSEMSETDENQENKLKLENNETNKVANQDTIMEIRRYLDNKKLTKINIVDDDDDDEDDDEIVKSNLNTNTKTSADDTTAKKLTKKPKKKKDAQIKRKKAKKQPQQSTSNKKSANDNEHSTQIESNNANTNQQDDLVKLDKNENQVDLLSSSDRLTSKLVSSLSNDPASDNLVGNNENEPPQSNAYTTAYARSYLKAPYGWLVDFINHFGELNGFKLLLERFTNNVKLSIQVIVALLKPWGLCYQFLTPYTVKTYFLPIIEIVPKFFENLSDEDIKKECKSENKNDSISSVIKWLKLLATRVQNQEELCKDLEILRLKTILRILKFASFNGKMNALNEVNKVISNITYSIHIRTSTGPSYNRDIDEEWLTSDRMAKWIQENDVLDIVLRDCMHQPQYVEKLEKILRFLIKEKALTLKDLDKIWESQLGKHEAIEKNVHDLLSKLAWDFTPEQLDHLFSCFQKSWTNASKKQREKLLDLIRSLSEDDKEGVMANKVLDLLWNLAHSDDAPTEIIDQAIAAHIKILDYSCSSDKEAQKLKCLEKCIEQLKENKWVIVSLRQIREILQQYPEMISGSFQTHRLVNYPQQQNSANHDMLLMNRNENFSVLNRNLNTQFSSQGSNQSSSSSNCCFYRTDIIAKLQKEYSLISMITKNLSDYYETIQNHVKNEQKQTENLDPDSILIDGRFNHSIQIQERLNFLKYLLKEGQLWLCSGQAESIWKCLAQNSVFESDREICFKWFSKLMNDDPDLEPDMNKTFFVNYITKLDPKLLTDSGIKCFDRFFKNVNLKNSRLVQKRNFFLTESLDLIGLDYLWKIVSFANEDIVEKAILLLKDIYIHLGPQLKSEQSAIHADLISNCMDRLRVSHDNLTILNKQCKKESNNSEAESPEQEKSDELRSNQEITQILRVMIVLREYLNEFDASYLCERVYPPLCRASKGKSVLLLVRLQVQNRQADDIELISHVNETIGSLRRQIFIKTKINPQINKIDLIINNECVECVDDNKMLAEFQFKEKMFIIARVTQTASGLGSAGRNSGNNMNNVHNSSSGVRLDSSAESSSDECGSGSEDSHNVINPPNVECELMLPSVILSLNEQYVQFLIELADFGCKINNTHIKECTRGILDLLPIAKHTAEKIKQFCKDCTIQANKKAAKANAELDSLYFSCTQTQCWYYLKVTHALLIPAVVGYNPEETKLFQESFILAGGVSCAKNMLVKENFLSNADDNTKKAALLYALKINKLTMATVCHAIYSYVLNAVSTKNFSQVTDAQHNHALLLQNSTSSIPSNTNEITIRNLAQRLGAQFASLLLDKVPEVTHILKLEKIAWSLAANGTLGLVSTPYEKIHDLLVNNKQNDSILENLDDINVCREALEVLSLSLCLVPHALENLNQEKHWRMFMIDLVLLCGNRVIRQTASEQFLLIALKCSPQPNRPLQFFIQMLFTCLHSLAKNAQQSQEYFYLLCRLLNCANINNVQISNTETLLNNEINWLKKVKQTSLGLSDSTPADNSKSATPALACTSPAPTSDEIVDEMLLDGHLNITKELLLFQNAEKKHAIGCHPQGNHLINDLIEYFVFPASYIFKKYRDSLIAAAATNTNNPDNPNPTQTALNNFEKLLASKSLKSICNSSMTVLSAYDLLVSLCTGCLPNFQELSDLLFQLFYPSLLPNPLPASLSSSSISNKHSLYTDLLSPANSFNNQLTNDCTIAQNEWEYMPPIGQRPHNGFVGLKNAGATCYMNSVLQQLFMIKNIRNFILSLDTSASSSSNKTEQVDASDDLDDTDTNLLNKSLNNDKLASPTELNEAEKENHQQVKQSEEEQRKEYNMSIFRHLQMIFGHLAESKMQYYVPKGFWRQFRFGSGERVNLREQHDAVEFFNSVVDCIDESMKSIGREQICSKILGGVFADQKICKGCPHRYSREESFTLLSVDVKHSQRLSESLEQYVKGDLLEGPNAYHCEKCNKKIDAVKRTCIKRLPVVLAIQLKRFDYDWEREIAVKSNEYFEFPRELDMEPYTVKGVAQIEKQQEILKQQQMKKQQSEGLNTSSAETKPNEEEKKPNEIEPDNNDEDEDEEDPSSAIFSTKYRLVGIVVHSGQANGGHYYSFIQNRSSEEEEAKLNENSESNTTSTSNCSAENNWYKFDDGEVSEFKMDDEEMRNQCYGGDYTGEVYDNVMKRMAYKKQKRWWNAYILFYERVRVDLNKSTASSAGVEASSDKKVATSSGSSLFEEQSVVKMPAFILRSVHKKNVKFLHHRHHFSVEYFQFVKKLTQANLCLCQGESPMSDEVEDLCLASAKLAFKFLFGVGFRVKKALRGPVNDWYEILFNYVKYSFKARNWMIYYLLIENSVIIAQYLLDCPSNEIRNAISKILVALVHLSNTDPSLEIKLTDLAALNQQQQQPSLTILVSANSNSNTTSLNSLMALISQSTSLQSPSASATSSSPSSTPTSTLENKIYAINQTDSIIHTILNILTKRDLITEQSSKYLIQYFQFFNFYSSLGLQQCLHLIRCDVPLMLIQFALDELPMTLSNINLNGVLSTSSISSGSSFSLNYSKLSSNMQSQNNGGTCSSQYADLNKLYCVVSTLLRCFDVSSHCASFQTQSADSASPSSPTNSPLPNPYSHQNEVKLQQQQDNSFQPSSSTPTIKLPPKLEEHVYKRSNLLKKLLEDAPNLEETIKLMRFLCWENLNYSLVLINELLWMIAYHYSYELKPHLEMLYHILCMNDTWQMRRIMCSLQGIANEREGLFEIIAKSQNHYQKRAYQIIKMLVQLFTTCDLAIDLMNKEEELKRKWKQSRNWFFNEMEKCRMYNMPNYSYFQTPQSNETSQTYFLERTQSARLTLEKALRICPQNMTNLGPEATTSGNNDEQVENDEEEAYESISDEENLEFRSKAKDSDNGNNNNSSNLDSKNDN